MEVSSPMFVKLVEGYGNTSNLLIQNAHFESYCYARGYNYSSCVLSKFFERRIFNYSNSEINYDKRPSKYRPGFLGGEIRFDFREGCVDRLDSHLARWGRAYVKGWGFRDPASVRIAREHLIKKYSVNELLISDKNLNFLDEVILQSYSIAIHVRRRDYKNWEDGKYYYRNDQWNEIIKNSIKEFQKIHSTSPVIILFTDDPDTISGISHDYLFSDDWYSDQWLMGRAHYIIGPPSTFSMWASFTGGAKLLHLSSADPCFSLKDSKVCVQLT